MLSNENTNLKNIIFKNNNSTESGGALYISIATGTELEDIIFLENNSQNGDGGALYIQEVKT